MRRTQTTTRLGALAALLRRGRGGSVTAKRVALVRAQLDRPHTPDGDPDAQRRICAGMAPLGAGRMRAHLEARTRFFDEALLAALARGTRQVVIVGAGYDDRALRFRSPGVRFFELDHPATQADKRRRLRRAGTRCDGLVLIGSDFRDDDTAAALERAGQDSAAASLFICEGLLTYLDADTIVALLGALRTRASADAVLSASLAVHGDEVDSATATASANARRSAAGAEPWLTIVPLAAHLELLHRAGWWEQALAAAPGQRAGSSVLVTARPGATHSALT